MYIRASHSNMSNNSHCLNESEKRQNHFSDCYKIHQEIAAKFSVDEAFISLKESQLDDRITTLAQNFTDCIIQLETSSSMLQVYIDIILHDHFSLDDWAHSLSEDRGIYLLPKLHAKPIYASSCELTNSKVFILKDTQKKPIKKAHRLLNQFTLVDCGYFKVRLTSVRNNKQNHN